MLEQTTRRWTLRALAAVVPAALALSGAAPANARPTSVDPPSGQFTVRAVNGNGCRAADTRFTLRDLRRIDVDFGAMQAQQGGGASAAARRASCTVSLGAPAGRGYTFGIDNVVLRGRATLPAGTTATASMQSWFVGQANTGRIERTLAGPFDATWDLRRVIRPGSVSWMPCGRNFPLNIQVDVRVGSAGARPGVGRISMDAGTNEPSASYRFAWKRC